MRQPRKGSNGSAPLNRAESCGSSRAALAKRPVRDPNPNPTTQSKGGGRRVKLVCASRCPICAFCRLFKKLLWKGRHIQKYHEYFDISVCYGLRSFCEEYSRTRVLAHDFMLKGLLVGLRDEAIPSGYYYIREMLPIIKHEPVFIDLVSQRPNFRDKFIFQRPILADDYKEGHRLVTTFSIDEEGVYTNNVLEFLPEEVIVLATCNGLVCCQSRRCAQNFVIYVCKPSTKEWTSLTAPRRYREGAFGLAYDPLSASYFKVVSARRSKTATNVYLFDIYCSRTRTWKPSKGICRCPYDLQNYKPFYLNNVIYWLTSDEFIILFDIEKEESAVIRKKPPLKGESVYSTDTCGKQEYSECLGEYNGELGCLRVYSNGACISGYSRFSFNMWSLYGTVVLSSIKREHLPQLCCSRYGKCLELEALGLNGPVIYLRRGENVFRINTAKIVDSKYLFSLSEKIGSIDFDCSSVQFCSGNIMSSRACREHSPFSKSTDIATIKWYQKVRSARNLSQPLRYGILPSVTDDMLREVLSWLPVKSLSRMKCVSKQWSDLISDTSLIRTQLQRSKSTAGFLIQEQHRVTILRDTSYFLPIDNEDTVEEAFLKFLPERVFIVASCNGLICCKSISPKSALIYICNPTLKQWIYVRPNIELGVNRIFGIGLVFDPFSSSSGMSDFKLVVIHKAGWEEPAFPAYRPLVQGTVSLLFEIYASETNSWRRSEETRDWSSELHGTNGIYATGKLHWLAKEGSCILVFDVGNESSLHVRLPEIMVEASSSGECLGESGGCVHYVASSADAFSVWVLVDYCRSEWNLKHQVLVHSLVKDPSILPGHRSLLQDITNGNRDSPSAMLLEALVLKDEVLFMKMELVFYALHLNVGRVKRLGSLSAVENPSLEPLTVHPNVCSLFSVYDLVAKV